MIRILIADDQTLMRDGLETILNLEDDISVVGTAVNGREAYERAKELQPDLVLLDIQMPLMNGLDSMKKIKAELPGIIVLILTTFAEEDYIVEALLNGAAGYLLKDMPGDKLIQSIRDAVKGQLMMPAAIASKLANRLSFVSGVSQGTFDPDKLKRAHLQFSPREQTIIDLMIEGKSNREIADTIFMSEGTIKNYISVIYGKIGINDRAKAVLCLKELYHKENGSEAG